MPAWPRVSTEVEDRPFSGDVGAQLVVGAGPRLAGRPVRGVSGPTPPSRYRHPGDVLRLITSGVMLVSWKVFECLLWPRSCLAIRVTPLDLM